SEGPKCRAPNTTIFSSIPNRTQNSLKHAPTSPAVYRAESPMAWTSPFAWHSNPWRLSCGRSRPSTSAEKPVRLPERAGTTRAWYPGRSSSWKQWQHPSWPMTYLKTEAMMPNSPFVIAADIGGTHIAVAVVNTRDWQVVNASMVRHNVHSHADAKSILSAWSTAFKEVIPHWPAQAEPVIGIAIPGPFDYENGI